LPVVEGPRVVDLEVEVHRAGLLRLEPELEGHFLVRLDLLDCPESLDFDGPADDRRHMLGGPVSLVRDIHLKPVPAVRLQPGVRRLEEEPRISVFQESFDLRFRGRLGPVDQGFAPFRSSRRIASSAFSRSASTSERSAWTAVAWATVTRIRSMSDRTFSRTVRRRWRASDSFARRWYSCICRGFFFWIATSFFVRY